MHKTTPFAWGSRHRELCLIPNQEGFRFIGVCHDGTEIPCEVIKDKDGLHTLKDGNFRRLAAWKVAT